MRALLAPMLFCFILVSCEIDYDMAEGTPDCMNNKLRSNTSSCDGTEPEIFEYEFQGGLVYLIDRHFTTTEDCVLGNPVYDETCEKIGTLWQGSTTQEINGDPWTDAVYIRRVHPN